MRVHIQFVGGMWCLWQVVNLIASNIQPLQNTGVLVKCFLFLHPFKLVSVPSFMEVCFFSFVPIITGRFSKFLQGSHCVFVSFNYQAKIKEKLGPEEQLKWAQEYINQGFTGN